MSHSEGLLSSRSLHRGKQKLQIWTTKAARPLGTLAVRTKQAGWIATVWRFENCRSGHCLELSKSCLRAAPKRSRRHRMLRRKHRPSITLSRDMRVCADKDEGMKLMRCCRHRALRTRPHVLHAVKRLSHGRAVLARDQGGRSVQRRVRGVKVRLAT